MADHRPNAYFDELLNAEPHDEVNEVLIIRASTIQSCERALIAAATGMEGTGPPKAILARYDESAALEDDVIAGLHAKNAKWRDGSPLDIGVKILDPHDMGSYAGVGHGISRVVDDNQWTVEFQLVDGVWVRGHMDGMAGVYLSGDLNIKIGQKVVIEAKAFGPDLWKKWLKKGLAGLDHYPGQCSIYQHASGLGLLFVVGKKNSDGGLDEVRVEYIPEPLMALGPFKTKARRVSRIAATGVVPDACEQKDYPCPFYFLHDATQVVSKPDAKPRVDLSHPSTLGLDEVKVAELSKAASFYAIAATNERNAKNEKDARKVEMIALLEELGYKPGAAVTIDGFDVEWCHEVVPEATVTRAKYEKNFVKVRAPKESA